MIMTALQELAGVGSGVLVGFSLGLIGGGGSILAIPLMVYLVGVTNPHVAIGTSAAVVAGNAAIGLTSHARSGNVAWPFGAAYAVTGVLGAMAGSTLGKSFDGDRLLLLFALVMVMVGVFMLRERRSPLRPMAVPDAATTSKVGGAGLGTGVFAGFFGIGGGFLIVPGLVGVTRMTVINAIGTSLVVVLAISLTTAVNYGLSGLIDWQLALIFISGGIVGSLGGAAVAKRLSQSRRRLTEIFVLVIFTVAAYMLVRGTHALLI